MEQLIFRVSEFCHLYAISKTSFYREVKARRLRLIKRGRRSYVERQEADRWYSAFARSQPQLIGAAIPAQS